jgi:hypothetical protein
MTRGHRNVRAAQAAAAKSATVQCARCRRKMGALRAAAAGWIVDNASGPRRACMCPSCHAGQPGDWRPLGPWLGVKP